MFQPLNLQALQDLLEIGARWRAKLTFESKVFNQGQIQFQPCPVSHPDQRPVKCLAVLPDRLVIPQDFAGFELDEAGKRAHQTGLATTVLPLEQQQFPRI